MSSFSARKSMALLVSGAFAATMLSVPVAQAAGPAYLSDPEYQELAVASTFTQALTYAGADVHTTQVATDGTYQLVIDDASGYATQTYTAASRLVISQEGGITPQRFARMSKSLANLEGQLPLIRSLAGAATSRAQEDTSEPVDGLDSYTLWFGFNDKTGNFDYLDKAMLGPLEHQALKNLGVPDATFLVDYGSQNYTAAKAVTDSANPAFALAAISNLATDGLADIGDITKEQVGTDTVYSMPITTRDSAAMSLTYLFTVTEDSIVKSVGANVEDSGMTIDFLATLTTWGAETVVTADIPTDAVTVDRFSFEQEIAYLYAVAEVREFARGVAAESNRVADVAETAVSKRLITRVAANMNYGGMLVKGIAKGVAIRSYSYPTDGAFHCTVTVKTHKGQKQASPKCFQPVSDDVVPQPPVQPQLATR